MKKLTFSLILGILIIGSITFVIAQAVCDSDNLNLCLDETNFR
jgi:hypothetical protein